MKQYLKFLMLLILSLALIAGINSCGKESSGGIEPTPVNPTPNNDKPTPEPDDKPTDLSEGQKSYEEAFKIINESQDYDKAVSKLQEAADAKVDSANFVLAYMYEYGVGVEKNLDSARLCYAKAAECGIATAKEKVIALTSKDVQNIIVLPKESSYSYKDVFVTSEDGVKLVNGNATFEGSGSSVKAMLGNGNPLYFSFNNKGHKNKVTLDSKETAASLLIAALPMSTNLKIEDQVFDDFKKEVKALPLTECFAKKIDECIVNNGYLDCDVLGDDFETALNDFLSLLSDNNNSTVGSKLVEIQGGVNARNDEMIVRSKWYVQPSEGYDLNDGPKDGYNFELPILVVNGVEFESDIVESQYVEFKLTDYSYDPIKEAWDCKFRVISKCNSFYLSLTKVKLPKTKQTLLDGLSTEDIMKDVIKPFVAPDIFTLSGWKDIIINDFRIPIHAAISGEWVDYYNPSIEEYSMEFKTANDAIAVTSFDVYHPDLFLYYLTKDVVWPLVNNFFKEETKKIPVNEVEDKIMMMTLAKCLTNDKIRKAIFKVGSADDDGSTTFWEASEEIAECFSIVVDEVLSAFLESLKDYIKEEKVMSAVAEVIKEQFGGNFGECVYNLVNGNLDVSAQVPVVKWVKRYKKVKKYTKMFQPLIGWDFKPFTVSLSPKSFPVLTCDIPESIVKLDSELYVSWSTSIACDVLVYVDSELIGTYKNVAGNSFYSCDLPTGIEGVHEVRVYATMYGKIMAENRFIYVVNPKLTITLFETSVKQNDNLSVIGMANMDCIIRVVVDDNYELKRIEAKRGEYYTIPLPTNNVSVHNVSVSILSGGEVFDEKTFSYIVTPPYTPVNPSAQLPSVSGSEINNGIPNSGYAPNVGGQNLESEYNSGGDAPSVKGQNLDQYYNGGGSTPDIKGTNL